MKRFSLLLGAIGGALGGYLLSNDKLRTELQKAKSPEAAAKLLGKHLQQDGSKIAKEAKAFIESDDVQKNIKKARKFATDKLKEAKKGMKDMVKQGRKEADKAVKQGLKSAKNMMKREEA
ncbi:MAG: hypothetical protein WCV62_01725 [Candidatus Peribacteraceae bacterium]|jgi:hypothetical protein